MAELTIVVMDGNTKICEVSVEATDEEAQLITTVGSGIALVKLLKLLDV